MSLALHTGAEYVAAITASESDRQARSAFRTLALRVAPPGGLVLDFGAGAGLDARYFAERGLEVLAYDNDPTMCRFLASHCRDLIASGRIALITCDYEEFLGRSNPDGKRSDVVIADFAPLNLITDVAPLFARLHALTAPDGKVLASVLSPYYLGDARYRWWWRNLPRLWRFGSFGVPGAHGEIVRRGLGSFAAQAAPYFTLERAFRGLPPRNPRQAAGIDWRRPGAWLSLGGCRFMFLLFHRVRGGGEGS